MKTIELTKEEVEILTTRLEVASSEIYGESSVAEDADDKSNLLKKLYKLESDFHPSPHQTEINRLEREIYLLGLTINGFYKDSLPRLFADIVNTSHPYRKSDAVYNLMKECEKHRDNESKYSNRCAKLNNLKN
tara:strand:+ start:224 stop:622 length:399 start_codon:yes stop_codon:yes gene_type:complete